MICSRSVQLRGQRALTNEYNGSVVDREWPLVLWLVLYDASHCRSTGQGGRGYG